ncbi:MAG: S8 family serine peptidase [Nitriliruptorales bacterium]
MSAAAVVGILLLGSALPSLAASDALRGDQWGLDSINAGPAWGTATGAGTAIAIVDTGIDVDHPELASRIVAGASWICSGGAAKPCTSPSDYDDENGHGTHVAGIAAAPEDGQGVVGVAKGAQLLAVRVLDETGTGSSEDVAAGIRWATANGADVINLSLSALPVVSLLQGDFFNAIDEAMDADVLVVAAAGNESAPMCSNTDFLSTGALCVGALDARDLKSSYSNFGGGLDVAAPGGLGSVFCDDRGEDILSTYALDQDTVCDGVVGYETLAGTSMAAPHAAGVGALLAELGVRGRSAADLIASTAVDLGTPGYDPVFGFGKVDAQAAVAAVSGG